jgi:hypothetical protein
MWPLDSWGRHLEIFSSPHAILCLIKRRLWLDFGIAEGVNLQAGAAEGKEVRYCSSKTSSRLHV